ncbi:ThiF family adenylyltransferase [Brevibacterium aurantiacum]|uniref:Molybdopterin biosynthesis protein n=1 Tax=Brevibacterium aurantiacum TaxID=273384 RepID=A0A556CJP3_BREAU|nr:ThiF family adenylyltransferase [Brevibacterium aurantiacum]TSI17651.1 molybdopterin biosynthesis protein [Brevibacterium aurantiacum]
MSAHALTPADTKRYARQIRLNGFGPQAQSALLASHVLVIGAGGLGAPVLTYLAAAGVGRISIIDPDTVELSNLHRQFIHSEARVGHRKVDSAKARMGELNSTLDIITHPVLLTPDNALELIGAADIVIDGSDNFATRYLANDACEILNKPLVWGTILGFDGQVAVFDTMQGATLRDLYPVVPAPGSVPDCATAGVLGALCGSIGAAMAMETIKVLAGIGTPLYNAVSIHSSLDASWESIPVRRLPEREPITELGSHLGDYADALGSLRAEMNAGTPAGSDPSVTWESITPGTHLVDIRDAEEVSAGMVPGARHIPMDILLDDPGLISGNGKVALYCRSGVRSARACAQLRAQGSEVSSVSGGYLAYLSLPH